MEIHSAGEEMMSLATELWPLNRSLTGQGVRDTLEILKRELPDLQMRSIPSSEPVFDWITPQEWGITEGYIITPDGKRICDYLENNLHVVGYSAPMDAVMSLEQLQGHLHSLPDQPNAIPYVTSYYRQTWGFCLTQELRDSLLGGEYRVVIKSQLFEGHLNYAELLIKGKTDKELFFSTYVCHPSMANNELSGPVLAVQLAKLVSKLDPYYSYRFIFIPETIGSLVYMSRNLSDMKERMLAGYVLTCVGDERVFSYVPSRSGSSVADKQALLVADKLGLPLKKYKWLDRGSDERQYCAPGADLPVCSIIRSKYGEYPEYHTSLDTLGEVVTAKGLSETFDFYKELILVTENQRYPKAVAIGEPQLGRRGLYPNLSIKGTYSDVKVMMDLISLADGTRSMEELALEVGASLGTILKTSELLKLHNVLTF
jgi:aminopeptidase-like protein